MCARADRDHDARAAPRADEYVLRLRWAMDEVPGAHGSFLPFDDQDCVARDDEEPLLIAFQWYMDIGSPGMSTNGLTPYCTSRCSFSKSSSATQTAPRSSACRQTASRR